MPSSARPTASPSEGAERLARALAGLRDPALRLSWTRDALLGMGAAVACEILAETLDKVEQRDTSHADLLLMASIVLMEPSQTDFRQALVALAAIRRRRALHELLRDSDASASDQAPPGQVPDFGAGRPIPLGERKSLARRRDRNLLARVLRDPHPDVIRILLDNPALTEADVLRLCALRPVAPEVLAEVFHHTRWIVRYRVRLTLALNPHTPQLVAVQLIPHLTDADRTQVAQAAALSERVRLACSRRPAGVAVH